MLNFPPWKQYSIIGICLAGLLVVLPNFLSQQTLNHWPSWLPKWQLSLGLDLRGGALGGCRRAHCAPPAPAACRLELNR